MTTKLLHSVKQASLQLERILHFRPILASWGFQLALALRRRATLSGSFQPTCKASTTRRIGTRLSRRLDGGRLARAGRRVDVSCGSSLVTLAVVGAISTVLAPLSSLVATIIRVSHGLVTIAAIAAPATGVFVLSALTLATVGSFSSGLMAFATTFLIVVIVVSVPARVVSLPASRCTVMVSTSLVASLAFAVTTVTFSGRFRVGTEHHVGIAVRRFVIHTVHVNLIFEGNNIGQANDSPNLISTRNDVVTIEALIGGRIVEHT